MHWVSSSHLHSFEKDTPSKFPEGYVFELNKREKGEVIKNFDNLETIKFSPKLPKAFTEKGLYMLATILKKGKGNRNYNCNH